MQAGGWAKTQPNSQTLSRRPLPKVARSGYHRQKVGCSGRCDETQRDCRAVLSAGPRRTALAKTVLHSALLQTRRQWENDIQNLRGAKHSDARGTPDRSDDWFDYASQERAGHLICRAQRDNGRWRAVTRSVVLPATTQRPLSINGTRLSSFLLCFFFLPGQG